MSGTKTKTEWVRVPLPKELVQQINKLLFSKGYSSVAEYIRTATREKLEKEADDAL